MWPQEWPKDKYRNSKQDCIQHTCVLCPGKPRKFNYRFVFLLNGGNLNNLHETLPVLTSVVYKISSETLCVTHDESDEI